jgi:hypothetical protein
MRGRNRGKNHNPLTKVYESNGPDVKIRGTASHVAEKYIQLARDAQSSGDPVSAESYYQHAEHYFRMIAAAQEQFRQNPPFYGNNRPEGGNEMQSVGNDSRDGAGYDDDGDDEPAPAGGEQPQFGTGDPQPYLPRDAQFYSNNQPQQQPRQNNYNNNNHNAPNGDDGNVDRLPSFITGGAQPQGQQPPQQSSQGNDNGGGFQDDRGDRGGDRNDRFGYRRRRHRRGGGGGQRPDHNNGMRPEGGDDQH